MKLSTDQKIATWRLHKLEKKTRTTQVSSPENKATKILEHMVLTCEECVIYAWSITSENWKLPAYWID